VLQSVELRDAILAEVELLEEAELRYVLYPR
jgi:hypothetical protein